jgi:hypothetical protein
MSLRSIVWASILLLVFFVIPVPQFAQEASIGMQEPAPQAETVGAKKTLVALFNFSDVPNQPFTLDSVRTKILLAANSTGNFIKENSYGKAWLDVDFVDWKTIQANSNVICSGST